jgi:adenosylmethionine-8-amino-7-oxononanoate aminotransferase
VPEIDDAIRAQLNKVAHSTLLGLANEPSIILADRLMKIVPQSLKKIFYSDSGATAAEVAFKLAAQYWFNIGRPEKNEFIGFSDAYHGDTVGAMSIGRMPAFHKPYFPLLFKTHFSPINLDSVEAILRERAKQIAAICIEPIVQGAGGILIQPDGFLRGVRELADRYDVLLIADEVATGFGRTGKMFACEHEDVEPDLMCIAKGITGGYLPLAATLASQKIFDGFLGDPNDGKTFFHGHTYTGNALACAAAIASLDLFEKHDLLADVRRKAQRVSEMLTKLPPFTEVRQKGLMIGIELKGFDPKQRTAAAVCKKVRSRGVILRPLGDVIVLMPPLAMPLDDLRHIVESLQLELRELRP